MFPDSFLSSSLYPTGTEMAGQVMCAFIISSRAASISREAL
jgi:hypothetical protein